LTGRIRTALPPPPGPLWAAGPAAGASGAPVRVRLGDGLDAELVELASLDQSGSPDGEPVALTIGRPRALR
jgi:hypothetical protein